MGRLPHAEPNVVTRLLFHYISITDLAKISKEKQWTGIYTRKAKQNNMECTIAYENNFLLCNKTINKYH